MKTSTQASIGIVLVLAITYAYADCPADEPVAMNPDLEFCDEWANTMGCCTTAKDNDIKNRMDVPVSDSSRFPECFARYKKLRCSYCQPEASNWFLDANSTRQCDTFCQETYRICEAEGWPGNAESEEKGCQFASQGGIPQTNCYGFLGESTDFLILGLEPLTFVIVLFAILIGIVLIVIVGFAFMRPRYVYETDSDASDSDDDEATLAAKRERRSMKSDTGAVDSSAQKSVSDVVKSGAVAGAVAGGAGRGKRGGRGRGRGRGGKRPLPGAGGSSGSRGGSNGSKGSKGSAGSRGSRGSRKR